MKDEPAVEAQEQMFAVRVNAIQPAAIEALEAKCLRAWIRRSHRDLLPGEAGGETPRRPQDRVALGH